MKTITQALQKKLTPEEAIKLLKDGNQRFIQNLRFNRNLLQQVNETAEGQYPFATILSCIDSRAPAELIFDQGLGDIFNVRVAGNIVNEDIIGSMEFSCKVAGSKLIMVLGHTSCGAIKGACDKAKLGHLTGLLQKIEPAIEAEKQCQTDRCGSNLAFVNDVSKINVQKSIDEIIQKSDVLSQMHAAGEIAFIGGMYDVTTGAVSFFD
ncbi:MAG: carbonic anhydrase [Gammaproteobacteria bacterium]|nr:carbonic anhydrase [Gammaproteobacteria bacterium]